MDPRRNVSCGVRIKAGIELVCDYKELHIIDDFIKHSKEMAGKDTQRFP
jgi:hypothetical protein